MSRMKKHSGKAFGADVTFRQATGLCIALCLGTVVSTTFAGAELLSVDHCEPWAKVDIHRCQPYNHSNSWRSSPCCRLAASTSTVLSAGSCHLT